MKKAIEIKKSHSTKKSQIDQKSLHWKKCHIVVYVMLVKSLVLNSNAQ